ncbi:MAG: DUF7482 domain-containing protein [Gemmatimonadales bacterium]
MRMPGMIALALAFALASSSCDRTSQREMGGLAPADALPPAVAGYSEGQEISFLHTEASDSTVAGMLTEMKHSPVLVVPRLAQVPPEILGNVFVFRNGVKPSGARGPFGFQPDVFDCPPSMACYTSLRAVNLVTWERDEARVLRSAADIRQAAGQGLLRIERPGIVVNMPWVRWPGGSR